MNCLWEDITEPDERGWRKVRCVRCGVRGASPYPHDRIFTAGGCKAVAPEERQPSKGPGAELHQLLAMIGIRPDECGGECAAMARQMNEWGANGCAEHVEEILAHLRKAYSKTNWATVLTAGWSAIASGLAFQINPLDPLRSLVLLAVERAKASTPA